MEIYLKKLVPLKFIISNILYKFSCQCSQLLFCMRWLTHFTSKIMIKSIYLSNKILRKLRINMKISTPEPVIQSTLPKCLRHSFRQIYFKMTNTHITIMNWETMIYNHISCVYKSIYMMKKMAHSLFYLRVIYHYC